MQSNYPTLGRFAAAGIGAAALFLVAGAAALGAGREPEAAPSPTPISAPTPLPTPSAAPTYAITPVPITAAPTAKPDPVPSVVVLDTIDDVDPRVVVDDPMRALVAIRTGKAGDGMSVRWNTATLEQVDPETIRVTWVGFPGEEQIVLSIDASGGAPVLVFDQMAPYANTDALGADRVLILTFDAAVNAADVEVAFPSVEASF
jgi:hypothetical protein